MKCPRTGAPLRPIKVGGIEVDVSEACGGAFFDNLELEKFKKLGEDRGDALVKHLKQFSTPLMDEKERFKCPKCKDVVMMRRYYSPLKIIEIDECPGCAGIWLDTGELDKIQDNQLTERELAFLRSEMIDSAPTSTIRSPKHRYLDDHNKLENIFELASYLFRS